MVSVYPVHHNVSDLVLTCGIYLLPSISRTGVSVFTISRLPCSPGSAASRSPITTAAPEYYHAEFPCLIHLLYLMARDIERKILVLFLSQLTCLCLSPDQFMIARRVFNYGLYTRMTGLFCYAERITNKVEIISFLSFMLFL